MNTRKRWLFCFSLAAISLIQCGCADIPLFSSDCEDRRYEHDVEYYRKGGFSEKQAESKAYENQFFRQMDRN